MSETTGFRIVLRDGSHTLRISNTEKTGYVTFKDSNSDFGIELSEEKFVNLTKYMVIEADKIRKSMKAKKPEADFKVETPEVKKEKKPRKSKKILKKIPDFGGQEIAGPSEEEQKN